VTLCVSINTVGALDVDRSFFGLSSAVERLKDSFGIFDVIMNDIDEVKVFHRGDQESVCWGAWFVHLCPLHAQPEGFVLCGWVGGALLAKTRQASRVRFIPSKP
jgi:hypothetical protein